MAVDYDLVIVGSSAAGIHAAGNAAQLQARVALVTQSDESYLANDQFVRYQLSEIAQFNYQLRHSSLALINEPSSIVLDPANNWIEGVKSDVDSNNSLANLAALGVDVIPGRGRFESQTQLELQVNNRKLRSRNFLLATGTNVCPRFSEQNNLDAYLTLRDLNQRDLSTLPNQIIVVGSNLIALELAQTLGRFDKKIILVIESPRILPHEDLDIAILVQAQLEAEGIKIFTNSPVSQIRQIKQQKWLQAGNNALSGEEIIITDHCRPNISDLNLAEVNVKFNQRQVLVNQKLQTTNPRIYACGAMIGGYCLPNIAQYEARLVLKNTLFFSWYKTDYRSQPWAVLTKPSLARVGLNETQAKQKYGNNIYVINQHFKNLSPIQKSNNQDYCKLLVQENGEILGCSIVSDHSSELIALVALMIKHKIKLESNPMKGLSTLNIPTIYPSLIEILNQACDNFYLQKLSCNPKLISRLRRWFSLRKNWHQ